MRGSRAPRDYWHKTTMWMVFAGRPSDPFYSFNLIKLTLQITSEQGGP